MEALIFFFCVLKSLTSKPKVFKYILKTLQKLAATNELKKNMFFCRLEWCRKAKEKRKQTKA